MIFLSHTKADKPMIQNIATTLAEVFGKDKVFYDNWSIQPGDSVISKINDGLDEFEFFFYFVSKNSLNSKMVDLEWQNALLKATKGKGKLIPVKIDDCQMPSVLMQDLYIDFFNYGPDEALRQMIDVINGKRVQQPLVANEFHNVKGHLSTEKDNSLVIELRAEAYTEPHSRYLILTAHKQDELEWKAIGESAYEQGFNKDVTLENGSKYNAILVARSTATSPGFPFRINLKKKDGNKPKIAGLMRAVSSKNFKGIPIIPSTPEDLSALQP